MHSDPAVTLPLIRRRMQDACVASSRSEASVRLLAVSKFHGAEAVRAAYACGQRDFGESYAQELAEKAAALADLPDLRWHFIGPVQRNKAKLIARYACMVHAIESERAAVALDRAAADHARELCATLQVNVAGEAQKHGVRPAELPALLAATRALTHLRVVGLMTLPPDSREAADHAFVQLAELARTHDLCELSMGMSGDLDLAIAHGATWIRVGSAIFGDRG